MLPLLNFKKRNDSILGKGHPFFKVILFLSSLTYFLVLPLRLEPRVLFPPLVIILTLLILSRAWRNLKIYFCMLLPFLSFFLTFSLILIIIYFLKFGFIAFPLDKMQPVSLMFIKGFFIISLTFVQLITINRREVLYVLKKIKMPVLVISLLMLVVRSLELIINEFRLLPLAWRSRGWGKGRGKMRVNELIHSIFYRVVRRSLIFEYALHSRHFNGEFFTLYSPSERKESNDIRD